jgi:hypothetical protein
MRNPSDIALALKVLDVPVMCPRGDHGGMEWDSRTEVFRCWVCGYETYTPPSIKIHPIMRKCKICGGDIEQYVPGHQRFHPECWHEYDKERNRKKAMRYRNGRNKPEIEQDSLKA